MTAEDRQRWDRKYADVQASPRPADPWLEEALTLIEHRDPLEAARRSALDLACGLGHNSVALARAGWKVDAVDISARALELARATAEDVAPQIHWIAADLDTWVPATAYDLVTVFRFLDRRSLPSIVHAAVRAGGWLIYETFANAQCDRPDSHIRNPAFTLAPRELSELLTGFETVVEREEVLPDRTVIRYLGRRHKTHENRI